MDITKNELKKMYEKYPNQIVCRRLKISPPTLIKLLKSCDIKLKGKGNKSNHSLKISIVE